MLLSMITLKPSFRIRPLGIIAKLSRKQHFLPLRGITLLLFVKVKSVSYKMAKSSDLFRE